MSLTMKHALHPDFSAAMFMSQRAKYKTQYRLLSED